MSPLPCALYRYFDDAGRLLYVGISLSAVARLSQHRDKPWFSDVARMVRDLHPTREAAEAAERTAIRDEVPLHNVYRYGGAPRDTEISPRRAAAIAERLRRYTRFCWYDIEDAAPLFGVNPLILERMSVPPSGNWTFHKDDLLTLADRMSRGMADDFEPLKLVEPATSTVEVPA